MKIALPTTLVAVALALTACESKHEAGVTSDIHSQWTTVNADVQTTTRAAEQVLNDQQLNNVRASSTAVDGTASAAKADGTKIKIAVRKQQANTSQVSVTVGTLGDPTLGAQLARQIKDRAESVAPGATPR